MTTIIEIDGYPKDVRRIRDIKAARNYSVAEFNQIDKSSSTAKQANLSDSVEISDAAKSELTKMTDAKKFASDVTGSGELTQSDLKTIRNRIDSKYYSDPVIISKIVANISDSQQVMPNNVTEKADGISGSVLDQKTAAFEQIQNRVREGFYFSDEVTGDIVSKMVDPDYV